MVILLKELMDNLRDRRSVATALLYALMGPLVMIPMLGFIGRIGDTKLVSIPVDGVANAPGLVEYLREHDLDVRAAPADPEQAVRDLKEDIVLVIPPSYAEDFRRGRPAAVRVVIDHSRSTSSGESQRVMQALSAYGQTVGALRLVARGVSPSVVSALAIETDDVATPESRGALLLTIVPMFLLMALLLGGALVAVDVTAGERERASLEPLMSTPLTAMEIVAGKMAAVMVFAFVTVFVDEVGFAATINLAPFPEIAGMRFKLDFVASLQIFAALIPLLLPIAALQMLLASRSRTVKEAYTAVTLCSIIPALPGLFLAFTPYKPTTASMTIPVFAQELLVNQILRGAPMPAMDYVLAGATATALGLALVALTVGRFAHARMLAGR